VVSATSTSGPALDLRRYGSNIVAPQADHLTAVGAVDLIVTNLAVIQVTPAGLLLGELAPGVTFDYVQSLTEPLLIRSADLREMEL